MKIKNIFFHVPIVKKVKTLIAFRLEAAKRCKIIFFPRGRNLALSVVIWLHVNGLRILRSFVWISSKVYWLKQNRSNSLKHGRWHQRLSWKTLVWILMHMRNRFLQKAPVKWSWIDKNEQTNPNWLQTLEFAHSKFSHYKTTDKNA